ncbi:MAG: hypothetical protein ACK5M7_02510 [Draconibacterium sp.]
MKKTILTLLTLTIFLCITYGQKVEKSEAKKIANENYKRNNKGNTPLPRDCIAWFEKDS